MVKPIAFAIDEPIRGGVKSGMLYKEDWEQAKERFLAWWNGEIIDRVSLQVRAPRKNYRPRPLTPPSSLEARWTDIDWNLERAEESFKATFFGGEAFPCFGATSVTT